MQGSQYNPPRGWAALMARCFLGLTLLVGVGLFFAMSFYAHPQTDDFCEAADVAEIGVWPTVALRYHEWTGRYFYIFVEANVVERMDLTKSYWAVGLVTLTLVLFAVFALVRTLTRNSLTFFQQLGATLGLYALYLALIPAPVHAFYWLTGAATNQLALITLLFAFALLLRDLRDAPRWKRLTRIVLASLFVGASVGSYDTTMMMLMGLLLLGTAVAFVARDVRKWAWLCALIVGGIGSAIVITAPGNAIRSAHFEQAPLLQSMDYSITNAAKWLVPFLLQPVLLIAALLFLPWGWSISRTLRKTACTGRGFFRGGKWMLGFIPLWGVMIVCVWLMAQYVVSGNPPPRTLNPLSMFVLVGVFASIVIVMAQVDNAKGNGFALPPGLIASAQGALAIALIAGTNFNTAALELKSQARAFDTAMQERYADIRQQRASGLQDVCVAPLPTRPTMLIHKDIGDEPYPGWAAARYWGVKNISLAASDPENPTQQRRFSPTAQTD